MLKQFRPEQTNVLKALALPLKCKSQWCLDRSQSNPIPRLLTTSGRSNITFKSLSKVINEYTIC